MSPPVGALFNLEFFGGAFTGAADTELEGDKAHHAATRAPTPSAALPAISMATLFDMCPEELPGRECEVVLGVGARVGPFAGAQARTRGLESRVIGALRGRDGGTSCADADGSCRDGNCKALSS